MVLLSSLMESVDELSRSLTTELTCCISRVSQEEMRHNFERGCHLEETVKHVEVELDSLEFQQTLDRADS